MKDTIFTPEQRAIQREVCLLTYERYHIFTPGSCAERLLSYGDTTFSHLDIMVFVFLIFLLFLMIRSLESDGYLGFFFDPSNQLAFLISFMFVAKLSREHGVTTCSHF